MAITPVNSINIDNKQHRMHYRDANTPVPTDNLTRPMRPQGHLIHDTILSVPKFYIKDILYDFKAIKNGLKGTADDHQIGRLNDVGIKLAGISIATYLASKTTDPKARLMEYVGLGAFLGAMSLYPAIAINIPSRLYQGYDIGKEYIDDKGRKKSVMQDVNYIPFDMYQGDYESEDLSKIGDALGIPRDIKNRDDVTKEQMRKIAIQNQTLWMWTAGLAAPVMSALICFGLEKVISPTMGTLRNLRYNSKISDLLTKTQRMDTNVGNIKSSSLSKEINNILSSYKGRELPHSEFNTIIELITKDLDKNTADGIIADVEAVIYNSKSGITTYNIKNNTKNKIISNIKSIIPENNRTVLEKIFVIQPEELTEIINKYGDLNENQILNFRNDLNDLFTRKMASESSVSKEYLQAYKNKVVESIVSTIKENKSMYIDDKTVEELTNFAKIIAEFKRNEKALDKCQAFKVEFAPETVLARSYEKFENTLFKVLDINYSELKQMKSSEKITQEILDSKITALVNNPEKYEEGIRKLTKVISDMEIELNGASETDSHLGNLITAIENNYNNTAKRLYNLNPNNYKNTIDRLVKEDISTLSTSIKNREDLYNFLDGTLENKTNNKQGLEYAQLNSKGVGSSKNQAISRLQERYQGVKNTYNRILHTLDVYNRPQLNGEYNQEILKKGKDVLLKAKSSDHILKFNTVNNPTFYKDIMQTIWQSESDGNKVTGKGFLTDATKKAIGETNSLYYGNTLERLQKYINRFRNTLGNNSIDFTKPEHLLNENALVGYSKNSKTRMSIFNLIGQTPVDLAKNAATKKYNTQKWFRTAAIIGGSAYLLALIAQLGFGKLRNPHNLQKQVNNDNNI